MTLTFDLYLTLTLSLTFDLDDLKKYIFFRNYSFCLKSGDVKTWRRTSKSEGHLQKRYSVRNVFQPTRSFYDFRFQSYGSKGDFHGFWCVWPWPWHSRSFDFLNSPFVPLHDWCKFWSDIFINSGYIVHWNMEKLPILYNGNFRCHGNVCYVFRINPFFCKLHRRGPRNMCVNFEKNRLNFDDFRSQIPFFINSTISHWLTYKIMQIF